MIDSVAVVHVMTACVSWVYAVMKLAVLSGSQASISSYSGQCYFGEREREEKWLIYENTMKNGQNILRTSTEQRRIRDVV